MTVGAVQMYDQGVAKLGKEAEEQWDGAGNFQFALLLTGHTPLDTHALWSDVSADVCLDADYDEILVPSRTISASGNPIYYDSADADFGAAVTIAARYLICVQTASAVAGTLAGTDKLIFRQDLQTETGNVSSVASIFKVIAPVNGWFSQGQA